MRWEPSLKNFDQFKCKMVTSLGIGNGWQSPERISLTFDFSQTETERTTNDDWQSPRISFSLNLSQTDRISPERRRREDATVVNNNTDFEFCVYGQDSITRQSLLPVADELFVDGKMLPLIHSPVEAQPATIARHLSLERLRCLSPDRSTSSSPSKIISSCWGNVASKCFCHKPPNTWKEMMSKLSCKENICAEKRRTSFNLVDQSQTSSTKSLWSFSRSCRTGGEVKGNALFRSSRISRSHSTAECKYKAATSGCTSKEIETDLSGLVEGSKPPERWSIGNMVQPKPQYHSDLKPRFEAGEGKEETKAKQSTTGRGKLGSHGLPVMGRVMSGQQNVGGKGMLKVRNLERSSSTIRQAARLDSPPPGKPMAEGYFLLKSNNSIGGGVRMNPVVNVPFSIGHAGGRWNGGGGLFGFFSKRDKKQQLPSAYHHHHSHASANRKKKKGT